MSEIVEHFGGAYELPEPLIIGDCGACNEEVQEFTDAICPFCGEFIHAECLVRCFTCDIEGCLGCMKLDRNQMEFNCRDCT